MATRRVRSLAAACLVAWLAQTARAHDETDAGAGLPSTQEPFEAEVQVNGRASDLVGLADSATEGVTSREDLERRPLLRAGELLESVPGVIVTQHSGAGKANQYFLRGFNLDHGTDFRIVVDGVPVNMPSHGHGQGYADLSFLIPEVVDAVRFEKGPAHASSGDFAVAGSAQIELARHLPWRVQGTLGSFDYRRLFIGGSSPLRQGADDLLVAVEASRADGPWERPDDFDKRAALVRWCHGDSANGLTLSLSSYEGRWNATDQIPLRALDDGRVKRFGTLDDTDGGVSGRHALSLGGRTADGSGFTAWNAYALQYHLRLASNFTYFLDDPVNGDQFVQEDDRRVAGGSFERTWSLGEGAHASDLEVGAELRADDIANGLFASVHGVKRAPVRTDEILQLGLGSWVQWRRPWTTRVRTLLGLRGDAARVDVDSDLAANSGSRGASLVTPRGSLVLGPWHHAEIYLSLGEGFHGNDARGATIRVDPRTGEPAERVDLLVRARNADVGVRVETARQLNVALTAFQLDIDSELVFVGDAGGTEAGRPSRRRGLETQLAWRPSPRVALDFDAALTRARFTDAAAEGDEIPGAISRTASLGLSFKMPRGLTFGLRARHFGPRPLIEDGSVRSHASTLLNGRLAWRSTRGVELTLEAFNLLDTRTSDIEYFYESRLQDEAQGVEDVHLHPSEPLSVRLTAGFRWGAAGRDSMDLATHSH